MLEKIDTSVIFYAHYIASSVGATGLTVTVAVWEITRAGAATEIVTGGSATEIGDGLYRYLLASGSVDTAAEYIAVFKTADTDVDQRELAAIWVIQRAGIENLTSEAGSGAIEWTTAITVDDVPISGADVWATSTNDVDDAVVASGETDGDGEVTFYLDAGTYYVWVQKAGYDFTNPTEVEVS